SVKGSDLGIKLPTSRSAPPLPNLMTALTAAEEKLTIPIIDEIEFAIAFAFHLKYAMFSDHRQPVPEESTSEASLDVVFPIGVAKISPGVKVKAMAKTKMKPDCDQVAIAVSDPTCALEGGWQIGAETGLEVLLKKLKLIEKIGKNKALQKFLSTFAGKIIGKVFDYLNKVARVTVSIGKDLSLTGDVLKDPSLPLGFRITNTQGQVTSTLKPGLALEFHETWLRLGIYMSGHVTYDVEGLEILSVGSPFIPNYFLPDPNKLKKFKVQVNGEYKIWNIQGEKNPPWICWEYPPGDFCPPTTRMTMAEIAGEGVNKVVAEGPAALAANDRPTSLVQGIYHFCAPLQIAGGNRRMVLYVHSRDDLPYEQSTDIHYLFFENDEIVGQGPVWQDTRFQDQPAALFMNDGRVLLVCQSMNVDDYAHTSEDILENLEAAAPHAELAWAIFDPDAGTWSAPQYLTNDAFEDLAPSLTLSHTGEPLLLFIKNSQGFFHLSEDASGAIHSAVFNGTDFSAPQPILSDILVPIQRDCRAFGSKTILVFARDQDDDTLTTPDVQLYQMTWSGNPPVWTGPAALTSGAAMNGSPRLLESETGGPRLIWQRDEQVLTSSGEPLAANPAVLMSDQQPGVAGTSSYVQVANGDIIALAKGYIENPEDANSIAHDLYYDYIDPTAGTLGIVKVTRDGLAEIDLYATPLEDGRISLLILKREILDDPTGEDAGFDLGQAWLYLFNIAPTPPPDYRIGIEPVVPGKVACNTDFQVPVVPDRTMKVYACEFTVAVDEGITIKSAAPGAGFQVQTASDGKSVRIWRTGAYPVAVRAVDEPLATLTLNAGGAAQVLAKLEGLNP
ncbi:MAG TPA: hypothetical protein PLB62_11360, partial [Candidatus Sumerlaeota bacterium]|nr:hypothetical protein [Candidatus Sumerlaeota bacterium]